MLPSLYPIILDQWGSCTQIVSMFMISEFCVHEIVLKQLISNENNMASHTFC